MWVSKQSQAIAALQLQLQELEMKVEKLKTREAQRDRDVRETMVEWKSTYEKYNTLWARLQRRIPKKAPDVPQEDEQPELPINPLAIRLMTAGGQQ
jgi:chromosome segregation ATPase